MTFKKWSLGLVALTLVAPLSASALGISVTNIASSSGSLVVGTGDIITFDLLVENSTSELINGLDVGVFGYDEGAIGLESDNNLRFQSAQTGAGIFGAAFSSGLNLGGLPAAAPQQEFGNPITSNERFARLFGGIATSPVSGDGTNDSGINGSQTNGSDVHLQVTFSVVPNAGVGSASPGIVNLTFGIGQQGYDVVGPSGSLSGQWSNAVETVTVVPEPGTALLMGLGLAGLAGIRRR
ncbi:MAG: hypothetical protein CL931_13530 [Deltaproteobacteria bacterium]|nr:hypothetical protein [Deltaproteobacteria bacterium]